MRRHSFRSAGKNDRRVADRFGKAARQFIARKFRAGLKTKIAALCKVKWFELFESESGAQLRVIAHFRMSVQRQMGAIHREIVVDQLTQHFMPLAGPRMRGRPKKPVMHDEQVSLGGDREFDRGQAGVHSRGDSRNAARILNLQTIGRAVVVLMCRVRKMRSQYCVSLSKGTAGIRRENQRHASHATRKSPASITA